MPPWDNGTRRKKHALVPVPNCGSPYVLRRAAGTRKDGVRYQSGSSPVPVWTGNEHQELADSARRLASRAYHSNDYASQEKASLHAFQTAVGEDLQLKCAERSCRTLEMAVETVEIQERYTKKAVRALKQEECDMALHLKAMGEKLEALMGEIKYDCEQRKQWAARRESGRRRKADMECHSCHQKGHFARECPTNTEGRSGNGQSPLSQ